ncbi:nuclear transport factor 2 family protein [Nocardia sp. NPDC001965]
MSEVDVEFHGFYAEGDRVIVEETMSATLANGNRYINDYCSVFELRDGLIHRVREYMDTARGHRAIFGESTSGHRRANSGGVPCTFGRQRMTSAGVAYPPSSSAPHKV